MGVPAGRAAQSPAKAGKGGGKKKGGGGLQGFKRKHLPCFASFSPKISTLQDRPRGDLNPSKTALLVTGGKEQPPRLLPEKITTAKTLLFNLQPWEEMQRHEEKLLGFTQGYIKRIMKCSCNNSPASAMHGVLPRGVRRDKRRAPAAKGLHWVQRADFKGL